MSDLINRKALIETIRKYGICGSGYSDEERKNDVIDMIESEPSAQQWIPCSERLPEEDENRKYLVCGEKGGIYIAEFVCRTINGESLGMSWWSARGRYCPKPIAWMPLPEAYKGE